MDKPAPPTNGSGDNRAFTVIGQYRDGAIHWLDEAQRSFTLEDRVIYRNGKAILFRAHPHYGYCKPQDVTAEFLDSGAANRQMASAADALRERNAQRAAAMMGEL